METQRRNGKERFELYLMIVTSCIVLAGVWAILLTPEVAWAEKGGNGKGNGNTGDVGGDVSGWIYCRVTFHDGIGNGVESDGNGEYLDGVDRAEMRIGRNRNMLMDFNTHKKKDSIRTLHFPYGIPLPAWPEDACLPILGDEELTAPTGPAPDIALAAQDAELKIHGEDHDDTPVGCCRAVNAVLTIEDDNGETWIIHFGGKVAAGGSVYFAPCGSDVIVQRLPNVDSDGDGTPDNPGFSRWAFTTDGLGYVYRDNNPPHRPTEFWGTVSLPFSGVIESLTDEPEPHLEPGQTCADLYPNESVNCQ